MDKDLSALAIGVQCTQGHVTLTGSADQPNSFPGRPRWPARPRVSGVTSKLTVKRR